jgi:iron complex transport system substrate-binding protein
LKFRRSYILAAVVGLVFATALGLRIQNGLRQTEQSLSPKTATVHADTNQPTDYVLHPQVVPSENEHGPRRILSLAPSITEIICALGMKDRLAGRTQYSDYLPGLENIEPVGAIQDANLNKIKALKPDLILTTSNSGRIIDGLNALGLEYHSVPHQSLAEVYQAIRRIGKLCARPTTAARLIQNLKMDIAALRAHNKTDSIEPKDVLVILGPLPVPPKAVWVAGPNLFLDELIHLAGHRNAAASVLDKPQGEIPLQNLLALNPDMILEFRNKPSHNQRKELYQSWSQLGQLKAIRNQQVYTMQGMHWLSAGPRIAIELHQIINLLNQQRSNRSHFDPDLSGKKS